MTKRMFSAQQNPPEILVDRAKLLRAEALRMRPGSERDQLMKQARQIETEAQAERWQVRQACSLQSREMIMTHVTSRSWTDADIIRLRQLSEQGASVARAAGALNRRTSAVAKVARRHNIELAGVRKLKAALRKLDDEAAFSVP